MNKEYYYKLYQYLWLPYNLGHNVVQMSVKVKCTVNIADTFAVNSHAYWPDGNGKLQNL